MTSEKQNHSIFELDDKIDNKHYTPSLYKSVLAEGVEDKFGAAVLPSYSQQLKYKDILRVAAIGDG